LVFTLLAAAAALAPEAAALAPTPCAVSVEMHPSQRTAEITATQPAAVTFEGTVTIDKPSTVRASVTLVPQTSPEWADTVSPASMTFAGGATQQNFVATVIVPAGTPASVVGQLTVQANAVAAGLSCVPALAQVVVDVGAYHSDLRARLDAGEVQAVGAPPSATFHLSLTMVTNVEGPLSVSVMVDVPQGMTHDAPSLVQLSAAVNGTASGSATFRVNAGVSAPGNYKIIVHASAPALNQSASGNGTMTVSPLPTAPGLYPLAVLGALASAAAAARGRRPRE